MSSVRKFDTPTKIHFVSPAGADIGAVFADQIVPHSGGTSFYLGKSCVAILSESYLLIGTRQLQHGTFRSDKPFWYSAAGQMIREDESAGKYLVQQVQIDDASAQGRVFKTCSGCLTVWETVEDFLFHQEIETLGFMANPLHPEKGAVIFNHQTENCGTILSVSIAELKQIIDGYEDGENAWLSPECDDHCLTDNSLKPCDHPQCKNAMVRDFLQRLRAHTIERTA